MTNSAKVVVIPADLWKAFIVAAGTFSEAALAIQALGVKPPAKAAAERKIPVVVKPKRPCVLRSVVVGTRRLILTESLFHVLGREPAPSDPVTVTIKEAQRLSSLSRATINRMMASD